MSEFRQPCPPAIFKGGVACLNLWPALSLQIPSIINGTLVTVIGALVCMVLAMVFAIPAGLGRLSRVSAIRGVSTFYVEVIRGTPLLLQLLIWYFGVKHPAPYAL